MIELLTVPEIRERARRVSVEAYHRMIEAGEFDDASVELIDGIIVEKMSKNQLHVMLVDLLLDCLKAFCLRDRFWVRQEAPITLSRSEPEPDISVISGRRSEFFTSKPKSAQFVIEVAVSSLTIDRAKARDYAAAGIPEFWIVRPESDCTEVFREPDAEGYQSITTIAGAETIVSTALPGFEFNLADALTELTES